AITALKALAHRGAIDADAVTGDGAGLLTQLPVELFKDYLATKGKSLFRDSDLGVGMIFIPRNDDYAQAHARKLVEDSIKAEDLAFLGWREVPIDSSCLGRKALDTQPLIVQALVARKDDISDDEFERRLFLAQNTIENKTYDTKIGRASCRDRVLIQVLNDTRTKTNHHYMTCHYITT